MHNDGEEPHALTRDPCAPPWGTHDAGSAPLPVTPLFLVAVPP